MESHAHGADRFLESSLTSTYNLRTELTVTYLTRLWWETIRSRCVGD